MMADMTAPADFAELCDTLYGSTVDPDVIWETVHKASPSQADLAAQRQAKVRRNVERGSNAVGIAAGSLGLAAALRDPRLARGGKVARALHRTGGKMPEFADKIATRRPRLAGALAAGAVGTQVANLGGDALIAGTLKDSKVGKGAPPIGADIKRMATNVVRHWKPPAPAAAPAKPPMPGGRTAAKQAQKTTAAGTAQLKHVRQGRDIGTALGTTTGKVAVGTVGAGTLYAGNKAMKGPSQEYAYGKADVDLEIAGSFTKFDDEKRQAFGWASVTKIDGSPVVDRQDDYIDIEDLETAAYAYVHKSRVGGDMHRRAGESAHKVSDMIESMVFTPEKIAKMGLPEDTPQGWWVGYQIHDEDTWNEVRKGGRTGFSIHGKGIRKDHALDDVMGY